MHYAELDQRASEVHVYWQAGHQPVLIVGRVCDSIPNLHPLVKSGCPPLAIEDTAQFLTRLGGACPIGRTLHECVVGSLHAKARLFSM